jgi:hypothetical protein
MKEGNIYSIPLLSEIFPRENSLDIGFCGFNQSFPALRLVLCGALKSCCYALDVIWG